MNKYEKAYKYVIDEIGFCGDNTTLIQELVERATPKKLIYKEYEVYHDYAFCQNNHKIGVMPYCKNKKKYCPYCGQALDWKD